MAIPTGYEKLAVIGIAYKNDYVDGTAYKLLNAVYYNGATYVALKDDPVTPPVADGINWQYLAKGFTDGVLSAIEAIDTSGLIGQAGATVGAQQLLDVIADKVATKLLAKNQVVNNLLATIPGNALDACQGKALMDLINQQNSDIKSGSSGDLSIAANATVTHNIVFKIPFNGDYNIVVSHALPHAYSNYVSFGVGNKTASGFVITAKNTYTASNLSYAYMWIAVAAE